jgi:hypothetical protein
MPPKFLLDENVEGAVWDAIIRFNQSAQSKISAVRVGDPSDLPLSSSDPQILFWAERNGHVIVSHDVSTLKGHLAAHLLAGRHCHGIFLFGYHTDTQHIIELLAVAAQTDNPLEWQDLIEHLG